jgi:Flp pilus assembly protein TadD
MADAPRARNGFSEKLTPEQQYNAHLELGRFQESQQNFELALGEYLKALEASESRSTLLGGATNVSKQALAHRRMASALDQLGRFEQAENEYRTALKLSPNDSKIWNDAGYSYYMQGRWDESERALKTAMQLDPHNTKYMTNLGLMLAASGKTDEALAVFTRAGGQAAGHANLAYVLATIGNTAEAEKHYKIALEFQPQLEPVRAALTALSAKTAYEAKIAAASRPATEAPPLLIGQSGVLPVAAIPQPPPAATALVRQASVPTAVTALRQTPQPGSTTAAATSPSAAATPSRNYTPGVLPATALRQPPAAALPGVVQAPAPSRPTSAITPIPNGATKPASTPSQASSVARPASPVPVDAAIKRTTTTIAATTPPAAMPAPAVTPRRPPLSIPPLPVPSPMPKPGPVPDFVPPATN